VDDRIPISNRIKVNVSDFLKEKRKVDFNINKSFDKVHVFSMAEVENIRKWIDHSCSDWNDNLNYEGQ
jgi:hypothetical protein